LFVHETHVNSSFDKKTAWFCDASEEMVVGNAVLVGLREKRRAFALRTLPGGRAKKAKKRKGCG